MTSLPLVVPLDHAQRLWLQVVGHEVDQRVVDMFLRLDEANVAKGLDSALQGSSVILEVAKETSPVRIAVRIIVMSRESDVQALHECVIDSIEKKPKTALSQRR